MSMAPLLAALSAIPAAFRHLNIIPPGDLIAVQISRDAGKRFEHWLAKQTGPIPECHTIDGPDPHREIEFGPVVIRWPVALVAMPSGRIIPDPQIVRDKVRLS